MKWDVAFWSRWRDFSEFRISLRLDTFALLLLWIGGPSGARGEVASRASVSAEAGRPLLLGCNVTTATGDSVHQVRWLDGRDELLLAYRHATPIRVSHRAPGVRLVSWRRDSSYIAIAEARPQDEGCYRCIFDVFPAGSQQGSTCVSVTARAHQDGDEKAQRGEPAALSCRYGLPDRVLQVLWKKTAEGGGGVTVASYSPGHYDVEETLRGRLSLSQSLGRTRLAFRAVGVEDEACYTCEFHTFPDGTRSATACLSVYVLPEVTVAHVSSSSGVTEANCTTRSRPAAQITWSIGGDDQSLNTSFVSRYAEGDGITTVTSTLVLASGTLTERSVRCVVRHQGLEKPLYVALHNTRGVGVGASKRVGVILLLLLIIVVIIPVHLCGKCDVGIVRLRSIFCLYKSLH
ncbi:OX-2 membrane glycoprotein-like isoform X1 [Phyllopteryx taeniolatus]|uniref:OX-2 membrane glycoprotein-like isoform X1 n=1 Tax=Phyllopteryx taeniolatus TaxID=161469 RepID=UPI002AD3A176|nr:OX-2 membrane glycoprotein-like isoform X1 [Phyllopteryx taeniolatus]